MEINSDNYEKGNKAMASVLLLYFHIMREGFFTGSETVYIDSSDFEGFSYLEACIEESYKPDIDENLIREGAIIYLLCELNDMVVEHDECFLGFEYTQKIIRAFQEGKMSAIPETTMLFELFKTSEINFNYEKYNDALNLIVKKYIASIFNEPMCKSRP